MNPETETLYLQQYNALNELKYIINNKIRVLKDQENTKLNEINMERLKAKKKIEKLRTRIDDAQNNYLIEKKQLNDELEDINLKLNTEESDIEKQATNDTLTKLNEQYANILNIIKQKQTELQTFDETKIQYHEKYQNDLFNIKIEFKGDKMAWNQKFDFLQHKLSSHQDELDILQKQWSEYHDKHLNKIADIKETIDVLSEELDNNNINKKIERRDNLKMIQQSLIEKKNYKIQIKKIEDDLANCQKEKEILIEKQKEWLKTVNEEYNLNISELKDSIIVIETKIKDNNDAISSVDKNIKNVEIDINRGRTDLVNSAWNLRQNLGELTSLGEELNKTYQNLLVNLNKIIKTQNDTNENDPFKTEINKINSQIIQFQFSINSLITRQNTQTQKSKFFYEKNKSKLQETRFEIKNELDNIEKLKLEYQNEEAKYNEEKRIKMQKINDIEKDIKGHHEYFDGLKSQIDNTSSKITDDYNTKINDVNDLIKKTKEEYNKLKDNSLQISNQKDELVNKTNNMRKKCMYRLEEINKRLQFIGLEMRQIEILELTYDSEKNEYDNFLVELSKKEEDYKLSFLPQLNELLQSQIRNNNELENIASKLNLNKDT